MFGMQIIIDYLQETIEVLEMPHIFVHYDEFAYLKLRHIYSETWRPLQILCCTNGQFLSTPTNAEGR